MRFDHWPSRILFLVLGSALCLRLIYLYQAVDTPLFEVLLIDSEFYDHRAREIIAGDWWGKTPFFMNPFYPYFLAAIYSILQPEYWLVGLVQGVMGVGSCYLLYWIGRRLWQQETGLVAAGIGALYQPFIFYDGALLTASAIVLLNLSALYCLIRSARATRLWLWGAGLLLGVSATARPMVLLFVLAVVCWFLKEDGREGFWRWIRVCAGTGLVVGAVVLRNYVVGGEWLLTTSSAGMNFYVGNHAGANGIYTQVDFLESAEPDLERAAFIREAELRAGRAMSPAQASEFWLDAGLNFAVENPLAYLSLVGRKFYMFWNRVEAQNNLSIYLAQDWVPLLRWCIIGWGIIAPLAVANWVLGGRRGRSELLDLYLLAYLGGCLLFFVSSEYRLPVVPVLLLYAARWVVEVARMLSLQVYRPMMGLCCLTVIVALPINFRDMDAERLTRKRVDYYNFASLYQRQGQLQRAEDLYRHALDIDPSFAPARAGLGRVLFKQGRTDHAATANIDPQLQRGLELFGGGEYGAAIRVFTQAAKNGVAKPQLFNNLGLSYYRLSELEEAIRNFNKALDLDPGYARAHFNMGLVQQRLGDDSEALRAFSRAIEFDPDYAKAHYRLGSTLVRLGRSEEAEKHWDFLLKRGNDNEILRAKIDSILQMNP